MILELESWRQGCHRGCLINMNAWILRRNQTFSDRKWIHLIWLPAFLRLLFSNSCESTSPRFWRKYIKPIYNIQQARKYIICNYFNIMLKKKLNVWNSTQFSIFFEHIQKTKAQGLLNCGIPTWWESMKLMEKNLACQDLQDEPWKGWGYSSAIQNWPYMYSALGLLSSITPIP